MTRIEWRAEYQSVDVESAPQRMVLDSLDSALATLLKRITNFEAQTKLAVFQTSTWAGW